MKQCQNRKTQVNFVKKHRQLAQNRGLFALGGGFVYPLHVFPILKY